MTDMEKRDSKTQEEVVGILLIPFQGGHWHSILMTQEVGINLLGHQVKVY